MSAARRWVHAAIPLALAEIFDTIWDCPLDNRLADGAVHDW